MNLALRGALDRFFTVLTGMSVVLLTLVLIGILGPMLYRGASAVFFDGTVEFRKMQRDLFERGDAKALEAEIARTEEFRRKVYDMIDEFKRGIDVDAIGDRAREIHREFGQELRYKDTPREQYTELRGLTREMRDNLEEALGSQNIEEIRRLVGEVLKYQDDPRFAGTIVEDLFELASGFLRAAEAIDLSRYHDYAIALREVEDILFRSEERPGLLGPRPSDPKPLLTMLQFGATRRDQAEALLERLLWAEQWVPDPNSESLMMVRTARAELFPESFRPLFSYVEENFEALMAPRLTFYWRFFFDDNVNGHYFGGVGPEILGTVIITLLGMLFVVPLGVISAAYLVECASESWVIRLIRMCINTLAGVPSIVFGLFGLAFFVLWLFPALGFEPKACMLTAAMTLALLTLPVMIRSSEEAIRTVPQSYKEGSLALGASQFRTFMTVTLPAALPGILTGVILSLSRIAGETAPILFTGAVAKGPIPKSVFDSTRTLSYGSYDIAVGDRIAMMVPHNQYGMVVTLILLVLVLNAMAIVLRSHVFKKLRGQ
jgi:phosphate transport system permease protein